ncbi:glycosyltransferase family 1 protein [bacterium]|nr:MAG: glycosyltransferase family 1 protein [bacterium]
MKIGIDARMFGSAETGIGNYVKNLVENIVKIDHENEYVLFMMADRIDDPNIPEAQNLKKVPVNSHWYTWSEQLVFPWIIYREKLDLMHFTHFNVPLLYRKPFIVTIHDVTPLFFPGHKMNSIIRRNAFKLAFNNAVRSSKKIISVSNFTKDQIVKNFNIHAKKVTTIYEGTGHIFQKEVNYDKIKELKERYGITKPFIFYVGVWRNHKNITGLIKAFDILRNKYKLDIQLVLGGQEDAYYPEVRETWEKLELTEHIIRPGFIKDDELPMFFKSAEVLARPSFIEGFAMVDLEAMSVGVPVAASNSSCLQEILDDAALYFDPLNIEKMAEVINRILTDKKLRDDLIQKGFRQFGKFSWEKCAGETLGIYDVISKSTNAEPLPQSLS